MGRQILGEANQILISSSYKNKKKTILCTMHSEEQREWFVFLPPRPRLHAYRHFSNKMFFLILITAVSEEYPVHAMKIQVSKSLWGTSSDGSSSGAVCFSSLRHSHSPLLLLMSSNSLALTHHLTATPNCTHFRSPPIRPANANWPISNLAKPDYQFHRASDVFWVGAIWI